MVEKVKKLDTVVQALTRKVLSLEGELTEIKKNNKAVEVFGEKDVEIPNTSQTHAFKSQVFQKSRLTTPFLE